jgi:tetratricopeptide (TPR) repeat protein
MAPQRPGLNNQGLGDTGLIASLLDHPRESTAWAASTPQGGFEYYLRGRAWCLLQEFDRGARDFEMAVSLAPDWPWSSYCLGHCNLLRGRWTEAAANFGMAISLLPKQAECRMYRAQAYQHTGDLARAWVDYDQALVHKPDLALAALGRGTVEYALGRYSDAVRDFQKARDCGADAAAANYNLALAYLANRDAGRALQAVRQALKANPRHEASRVLERKLVASGPR